MRSLTILPLLATIVAIGFGPVAEARTVNGPNGGTATGKAGVVNNPQGGKTGAAAGSFHGANGGSGSGKVVVKSNGQGSVNSAASGTLTTPSGSTYNGIRNANKTYTPDSGYSGNKTTTVNDQTYSTSTQNRSTTIVTPQGSQTIVYPARDR